MQDFFKNIVLNIFSVCILILIDIFFTSQARRSCCIYFVPGHSQWRSTTSCSVPCICSNLGLFIIQFIQVNYFLFLTFIFFFFVKW